MVLLHAAASLAHELQLHLELAHLDHGLRAESVSDREFVIAQGASLGCRCHSRRLTGPPPGENLEAWGRRERYKFFSELRAELDIDWVITAHHADDVAETFLMRLVSNKDLNGIERKDRLRRLSRPLLALTREVIEQYAQSNAVQYREDASNRDTSRLRNQVRHELIPYLREHFEPRILEVLSLRASTVGDDIAGLRALLGERLLSWEQLEHEPDASLSQLQSELLRLPEGVRWRFTELLLRSKLGFNVGRRHAELASAVLLGRSGAVELPDHWRLSLNGDRLLLARS